MKKKKLKENLVASLEWQDLDASFISEFIDPKQVKGRFYLIRKEITDWVKTKPKNKFRIFKCKAPLPPRETKALQEAIMRCLRKENLPWTCRYSSKKKVIVVLPKMLLKEALHGA